MRMKLDVYYDNDDDDKDDDVDKEEKGEVEKDRKEIRGLIKVLL